MTDPMPVIGMEHEHTDDENCQFCKEHSVPRQITLELNDYQILRLIMSLTVAEEQKVAQLMRMLMDGTITPYLAANAAHANSVTTEYLISRLLADKPDLVARWDRMLANRDEVIKKRQEESGNAIIAIITNE